jgi:catechol 2,3-dioxygenase-like lactoylglutathione lyase family enzyme
MIDHIGFSVSDYARAKAFYERALAPLGYALVMEVTAQETGQPAAGFGSGGKPDFWIGSEGKLERPVHVAIVARDSGLRRSRRADILRTEPSGIVEPCWRLCR